MNVFEYLSGNGVQFPIYKKADGTLTLHDRELVDLKFVKNTLYTNGTLVSAVYELDVAIANYSIDCDNPCGDAEHTLIVKCTFDTEHGQIKVDVEQTLDGNSILFSLKFSK